jgi:hypothetical protein
MNFWKILRLCDSTHAIFLFHMHVQNLKNACHLTNKMTVFNYGYFYRETWIASELKSWG